MTTQHHHHTTPPGVTQSRRAALLRLRADLAAAATWAVLAPVCTAAIARIDALLAGTVPTVPQRIEVLLPHLAALLDDLPTDQDALRSGVTMCIVEMERATGRGRTLPSRRERRRALAYKEQEA